MALVKWVALLSCGHVVGGTCTARYVPKPGEPANCKTPEHYDEIATYAEIVSDERLAGPDGRI